MDSHLWSSAAVVKTEIEVLFIPPFAKDREGWGTLSIAVRGKRRDE
jgi:hypothetical protein